jgi:fatty-acyl-CoA synthase
MPVKLIEKTPSAYSYPLLIKNLLSTPLTLFPKQQIVYRNLRTYDYTTLAKRIARLAHLLEKLGVEPGDTVAMMDFDSHRYLECFFAVPMLGAILHTINIRLTPEQILYTINHAEDKIILINKEFLPFVEPFKDQIKTVEQFVVLTDDEQAFENTIPLAGEYEQLLGEAEDTYDFPDFDENAQATVFYTTGTTGEPKGVYFSHRQLVLHTFGVVTTLNTIKSQCALNSETVYMPLTPMFHVHAWGFPYICTMIGAKQVYPGKYEPKLILELIEREKVTFSHCVPTVLHTILDHPRAKETNLLGWQIIVGGSALTSTLCKRGLDQGINLYTGYGMSETCPVLTIANLKTGMLDWEKDRQVAFRRKTGLPLPLVQIQLIDLETGELVPHDGDSLGEVVVRAPWLTQGYLKNTESSEMLWQNGWLHTGDIGHIDQEGYLQVTDRLKDMIKVSGEWIASSELEECILQHEAVSEVAVVGILSEKWGEKPCAFTVLKEAFKTQIQESDLKTFLKEFIKDGKVTRYLMLTDFVIVDAIPKTSVGKIDKKVLRVTKF